MATNLSGVTNKDEWIFSSPFWFSLIFFNGKSYREGERERKEISTNLLYMVLFIYFFFKKIKDEWMLNSHLWTFLMK